MATPFKIMLFVNCASRAISYERTLPLSTMAPIWLHLLWYMLTASTSDVGLTFYWHEYTGSTCLEKSDMRASIQGSGRDVVAARRL